MSFAVVVAQIDDLSVRRESEVQCEIVAIAYLMKRELVVPYAVVLVLRVLEDGFDPLTLVSLELPNQVQGPVQVTGEVLVKWFGILVAHRREPAELDIA
jgi:hypothetical protein